MRLLGVTCIGSIFECRVATASLPDGVEATQVSGDPQEGRDPPEFDPEVQN